MAVIYSLGEFLRDEVDLPVGRTGPNLMVTKRHRVLVRVSTMTLHILPRRRRIGRMGPAKVLMFPDRG